MHAQATTDCRSQHQLNLRLLRFTASPQREEPVMLAQDLLAARRPVDALEVVETAMEREPEDADLLLTLGVALLESGELAWARRVLTQAVTADSDWAEPWRWLGEALLKSGDQARAVRALRRARELDGSDQAVAKLLKSVTRWDELTRRLRRFHERPELVDPALLLQDLLEDGRLAEAKQVLALALDEDDDDPDLLLLKSRVVRRSGDLDGARDALQRATELDPSWEEAWRDLEGLLIEMGDEDAARTVALSAREAERGAIEAALAERAAREKTLAEERARLERLQKARQAEAAAALATAETKARADEEALTMAKQSLLARAAAEADARGREAAKAALLRATADARAAAARRAEAERAQKAEREAAERARVEAAEAGRVAEARKREDAFQRAWAEAEREARERVAKSRAVQKAEAEAARDKAAQERQKAEERAALAEGLQRAREAIWQQAKVEAERRIASTETPNREDVEAAAFARAKEELEAEARREARKLADALAEQREAELAAAREAEEREAALEKARRAAAQQRLWEATSASRSAAASRAMALAAKMASDAQSRVSSLPPPRIVEDEPVFELSRARTFEQGAPSESELDAMLDDLLGTLDAGVDHDTLRGMPAPGASDGGVGMTQAAQRLRTREGATAYQPATSTGPIFDTAPGIPACLETLH